MTDIDIEKYIPEKDIHRVFIFILIAKGIHAIIEIVGGLLFLIPGVVDRAVILMTRSELIEDPGDMLALTIRHALPFFSDHGRLFASFYLLSHGIVKIFLVVAILRNKLWAYPATIVTLALFILYQIGRFTYTHSIFLILLSIFDIFLIALTWHEYNFIKGHLSKMAAARLNTKDLPSSIRRVE